MYIEQGYKGNLGLWKYLPFTVLFFGVSILGLIMVLLLNIDLEAIMSAEIERKGMNRFLIEQISQFALFLVLLFLWVKYAHKQSITSLTTSRKKVDWKRILFSFGLWALVSIVMVMIGIYLAPDDYVLNFNLKPFLILAAIGILLIPFQTSFEEYFFRAYLMQGIGLVAKNKWMPLFVTSILFGLMHIANPEVGKLGYGIMVYYIGTGFLLGIMTLMDEGLELALGFHASNNIITALLVTADWTVFQTDSIYRDVSEPVLGWDVFIPVLVLYPLLLFIFSKKYGWTNWKDKLFGKVLSKEALEEVASKNVQL
ncbi:MAG: CPBP family intramembrane metalloprotease domain-containing protein [Flavobacteriaceae bacterium]|nr:MAG: CPBP family intramembrane metalloprotease domain-containing protein [Flavobacteriaceae bacterium]